jgi:hypothetical protein
MNELTRTDIVLVSANSPDFVDLTTASRRTGLHPELIVELINVHLVSAFSGPRFDQRGLKRLHQIANLREQEHLPFRMVRSIVRLIDRLENAETELRKLRDLT